MKLVASVVVRNELQRYLMPFIYHLSDFCDEIVVLDDHSTDGGFRQLTGMPEVTLIGTADEPLFFVHEGRFRNALLEMTLSRKPTHILAIDADEFVTDGQAVRNACAGPGNVFTLRMEEVWKADENGLQIRVDGGWRQRNVPILYRVPPLPRHRSFKIADRAMACGREPQSVAMQALRGKSTPSGSSILHFGWTREAERDARYQRYVQHDLGKSGGHADMHLRSIMWPDDKVTLEPREWPPSLDKEAILE
jgi:hypothetical protein